MNAPVAGSPCQTCGTFARGLPCGAPLAAALVLASLAAGAAAQTPRSRALNYDPATRQWAEAPVPPPGTAEGDLYLIRRDITAGRHGRALSACKKFVKTYGDSDAQYPNLLLARAQAQVAQRDYKHAHETLQEYLNRFSGMAQTGEALRLEFIIAEAYLSGAKRKFLGIPMLSGFDLAYTILDDISANFPDDPAAVYAIKTKADHLFKEGEHALAEAEYSRLLTEHPRTRYAQPALKRAADAALAGFRGTEYDDSALIEAQERYQDYRLRYAADADREGVGLVLNDIREKRAEKELSIAAYYERTAHLSSAVFYYQGVVRDWPDTAAAAQAASRLALLGVES